MWRSFFMALGIMLILLGVECLVIDSASVYAAAESSGRSFVDPNRPPATVTKTIRPTEGLPWILVTIGAITILYSISLPKRMAPQG